MTTVRKKFADALAASAKELGKIDMTIKDSLLRADLANVRIEQKSRALELRQLGLTLQESEAGTTLTKLDSTEKKVEHQAPELAHKVRKAFEPIREVIVKYGVEVNGVWVFK